MLLKLISVVRIKTLEFRKGTQQEVHTCNQIHQERKSLLHLETVSPITINLVMNSIQIKSRALKQ